MKKFMILMCMILVTGNITACGSVHEEFKPAEEVEAVIPETSAEDKQIQIYETIMNQDSLTCNPVPIQEETLPPEFTSSDKDAELLAMLETQLQAVKDNDFESFWKTFDMAFVIDLYIAEDQIDAIAEMDKDMLNYFNDLCEDIPEVQEIDTTQGSLTDWMIKDMSMMENGVKADCTAVVEGTSCIVEFELYASGDRFIALVENMYEDTPVQNRMEQSENKDISGQETLSLGTVAGDAKLITLVEAQMLAVKNNDFDAFRETFDMDFMLKFHIEEGWAEDMDSLNEEMLDYFHDLCEDLPELHEIARIQGCLTDWTMGDIEFMEYGFMRYYTAFVEGTSYIVEFEVYSFDDQSAVLLNDVYHSIPVQSAD